MGPKGAFGMKCHEGSYRTGPYNLRMKEKKLLLHQTIQGHPDCNALRLLPDQPIQAHPEANERKYNRAGPYMASRMECKEGPTGGGTVFVILVLCTDDFVAQRLLCVPSL